MYSEVLHFEDVPVPLSSFNPVLCSLIDEYRGPSGEGLAGSVFEGGVFEDEVNLESRVSSE